MFEEMLARERFGEIRGNGKSEEKNLRLIEDDATSKAHSRESHAIHFVGLVMELSVDYEMCWNLSLGTRNDSQRIYSLIFIILMSCN